MFQKFTSWKRRHGIEFFGIMLCVLLAVLAIDTVGIFAVSASADQDYLSSAPYYSSRFITSRSQLQGDIVGFYVNPERTRCGIMVNIEDIMNMSTNALDYEVYARGFNVSKGQYVSKTQNQVSGGYYVFGNTGYAMIYLVNSAGFAPQASELIVRSNKTLVEGQVSSDDLSASMEALKQQNTTFAKFDQYRLVINPAASGAQEVDFLDSVDGTLDVMAAYRQCVLDQEEAKIRSKLYDNIGNMNMYMNQINEYADVLGRMSIRIPALSEAIVSDTFVSCPDSESGQVCDMYPEAALPRETVNEDGTVSTASYPVYKPGYVYNNGVNFDWQHRTLSDGTGTDYFENLLLSGQTKVQYLQALKEAKPDRKGSSLDITKFAKLDGTRLTANMGQSAIDEERQTYEAVQAYIKAVTNYESEKYQYQTVNMPAYLNLQYNMERSAQTFTSNLVDGAVRMWGK